MFLLAQWALATLAMVSAAEALISQTMFTSFIKTLFSSATTQSQNIQGSNLKIWKNITQQSKALKQQG